MIKLRHYLLVFITALGAGAWWFISRNTSQTPPDGMPPVDSARFHDVRIFVDGQRADSAPIEITPFQNHSVTGTFRAAGNVAAAPNIGATLHSSRADFRAPFGFQLPLRLQPDGLYHFGGEITTIEFEGVVELRLTASIQNDVAEATIGRVLLSTARAAPPRG